MAYQALYRRYRPRTFSGVLGQEHITSVLKNQIMCGKTSHAYIFSGTRGTGKTSTAKIFARAINCLSPVDGEPCGVCDACVKSQADCVDIIEMDAASNNGVDDIRALIDKASFTPLYLKKKVYILDEAHMISGAAFGALLKTIEEPPAHVVFILATTEPRSIPATIASRCQRFDFHRISITDMLGCMTPILSDIGAKIDNDGLIAIARAADGAMRDALSIADQCVSFFGSDVSAANVYEMLGSMDTDFMFSAADTLLSGDKRGAVSIVDRIMREGRDLNVFTLDMASHFRSLLLAKLCGHCPDILDCTEDAMRRYEEQAKGAGETTLTHAIELLSLAQSKMRYMPLPRILLESTLLRIASPEEEKPSGATLLLRVEQLERRLDEGIAVAATAAPRVSAAEVRREPSEASDASYDDAPPPSDGDAPWDDDEASSAPVVATKSATPAPRVPISVPAQPAGVKEASAHTGGDPKALWKAIYDSIKSTDPALAMMALKGAATSVENGALRVMYEKEVFYAGVTKSECALKLNAAAEAVSHGLRVEPYLRGKDGGISEQAIESAKQAFGGKLQIIE